MMMRESWFNDDVRNNGGERHLSPSKSRSEVSLAYHSHPVATDCGTVQHLDGAAGERADADVVFLACSKR